MSLRSSVFFMQTPYHGFTFLPAELMAWLCLLVRVHDKNLIKREKMDCGGSLLDRKPCLDSVMILLMVVNKVL